MSKLGRCANSLSERSSSSHAHLRDKPGTANWAALGHCETKKKPQLTTLKAAGADHRGRIACRRNRKCQKASRFLWPRAERWAPTNVLSADQNRALASHLTPVSSVLGFPVAAVAPGPSGPAWKCRENIHFWRDEIVHAYWGSREPCQIHSIWQLDLTYLDSGESVFPTCSRANLFMSACKTGFHAKQLCLEGHVDVVPGLTIRKYSELQRSETILKIRDLKMWKETQF